ncbi:hypothetical protein LCGC14_2112550, partial [marine sediment metagenome]
MELYVLIVSILLGCLAIICIIAAAVGSDQPDRKGALILALFGIS